MSILNTRIFRADLLSIVTAIMYIVIFRYIYTLYLVPTWSYMGYKNSGTDIISSTMVNVIAVLPILFYSGKKVISNFITILLYCFAYIPMIIAFDYYYDNKVIVAPYYIVMTFAMISFFCADKFKPVSYSKTRYIPQRYYVYLGVAMSLIVFLYYGPSNLKLVSFDDIYELRAANSEFRSNSPIVGYLISWTSSVFMPLFLSFGLVFKNKKLVLVGIGIAILMYAVTGQKSTILMPIILYAFERILTKLQFKYIFPSIVLFTGVIAILVLNVDGKFIFMLGAVYLLRTVGISSILACSYIDVFDLGTTSYTYFSHIRIINRITSMYPFKDPSLGKAVWAKFSGDNTVEAMNANANFFITDGIAAGGYIGVTIISIVFYCTLRYLNKISYRHNDNFVFLTCLGASMKLLNVSLFTTMVTGGLIIIMIFYRYTTVSNRLNNN